MVGHGYQSDSHAGSHAVSNSKGAEEYQALLVSVAPWWNWKNSKIIIIKRYKFVA